MCSRGALGCRDTGLGSNHAAVAAAGDGTQGEGSLESHSPEPPGSPAVLLGIHSPAPRPACALPWPPPQHRVPRPGSARSLEWDGLSCLLWECPRAAVTISPGAVTTDISSLTVWRPEVEDQSVSRADSARAQGGSIWPLLLRGPWEPWVPGLWSHRPFHRHVSSLSVESPSMPSLGGARDSRRVPGERPVSHTCRATTGAALSLVETAIFT